MAQHQRHTILYDTTLRDGAQSAGLSYSLEDKLRILCRLDALGIPYIEGGFPAANPKDAEFFARAATLDLTRTRLVAFGTLPRRKAAPDGDKGLRQLLAAGTPTVCLLAKASQSQVAHVLKLAADEHLTLLADSISFLKANGREVIVDLEHYFDGWTENPDYALSVLRQAVDGGADTVVLADTNGGFLPTGVTSVMQQAGEYVQTRNTETPAGSPTRLGVHFHNDTGCAVANSLLAVAAGAEQVQGTINGYGERAGNTDLLVLAASLVLKRGDSCLSADELAQITEVSRFVADTANLNPDPHQPYMGAAVFTHKAGIHVSALQRLPHAYEHIDPAVVGNHAQAVVSELAGRATLKRSAAALGMSLSDKAATAVLARVKDAEARGYSFEAADGSLALIIAKERGEYRPLFKLESFRVIAEKREDGRVVTEATIKLHVAGERFIATAEGNGPVNALDRALRRALTRFYPELATLTLTDYKVRVLDEHQGTDATTRVLITSGDGKRSWGTVGLSENIIEASWEALVDSLEYGLGG
jgi:2-isopropylmalate synthase